MSNSLNDRFVECIYGRLNRFRCLSKDYEVYLDVSKVMIYGLLI